MLTEEEKMEYDIRLIVEEVEIANLAVDKCSNLYDIRCMNETNNDGYKSYKYKRNIDNYDSCTNKTNNYEEERNTNESDDDDNCDYDYDYDDDIYKNESDNNDDESSMNDDK